MSRPRVWVTRAEPGAARTAARLEAMGYEPVVRPLLAADPDFRPDIDPVIPRKAWALAFTSPNAVAAYVQLGLPVVDKPVFAVGDATADAAREVGFGDVASAAGDLSVLAALIAGRHDGRSGALVAFAAAEPAGDLGALLADVIAVQSVAVHRMVETGASAPPHIDAVLIHSPRAARALASAPPVVSNRAAPLVVAISPAVADLIRAAHARLCVADAPDEAALLAALKAALGNPEPGV